MDYLNIEIQELIDDEGGTLASRINRHNDNSVVEYFKIVARRDKLKHLRERIRREEGEK